MCGTTLVKSTAEKKEETLSKGIATTRWQLGPSAGQSLKAKWKLGNGVIPCKMKNFTSWIWKKSDQTNRQSYLIWPDDCHSYLERWGSLGQKIRENFSVRKVSASGRRGALVDVPVQWYSAVSSRMGLNSIPRQPHRITPYGSSSYQLNSSPQKRLVGVWAQCLGKLADAPVVRGKSSPLTRDDPHVLWMSPSVIVQCYYVHSSHMVSTGNGREHGV